MTAGSLPEGLVERCRDAAKDAVYAGLPEDEVDHTPDWVHDAIIRAVLAVAAPALREQTLREANGRPRIVCLCGSTRFYEWFQRANYEETMAGRIVLSVGFYPHAKDQMHHEAAGCTPEQKIALDDLHKQKIDLADEVLVLNVGGYIGDSTRGEIEHATATGKPVRYLEAP